MAYSAALPLIKDPNDGFAMLKTIQSVAKQNLKMLLYTEQGERINDSNFGVGIKRFLFEQNVSFTHDEIKQKIRNQVRTYLPYITIQQINIYKTFAGEVTDQETDYLKIDILFSVEGLPAVQVLQIT